MLHSTDAIMDSFAGFVKFCIERGEIPYFNHSPAKIDKFFYEIKQKYPKEFEMVSFNTNGNGPFSEVVDQAKMDMLICGNMMAWGFNPYFISKNILKNFEERADKKTYLDIGEKFYKDFGCDENGNTEKRTKFKSLESIH